MPKAEDYALKLARAHSHLEYLDKVLSNWTSSGHHEVINEPDLDRGSDWRRVRVEADPVPIDPFAIIIGDVLHNLRCTLDHLVYALAIRYTTPLPDDIAKTCEFPIYWKESSFQAKGRNKLRGINPRAKAIIQGLQPYNRGNDFESHPLWILHELSNIDKHRMLHLSTVRSVASVFRPDLCRNWRFTEAEVYNPIVQGETIAARYRATPLDPEQEVYVEFEPLMQIVFGNGSIVNGKGVISTLATVYDYIIEDVIPPLNPFL